MPNNTKIEGVSEAHYLNSFVTLDFFGLACVVPWHRDHLGRLGPSDQGGWLVGGRASVGLTGGRLDRLLLLVPGQHLCREGIR